MAPNGRRLFSQTAEHALRAALYLGRHEGFVPAGRVAAALGTPPNYTAKTLAQLERKGVLRSGRGPRGGYRLAVEPSELSLGRVLDAVDEPRRDRPVCLLGDRLCDAADPCRAHARWSELLERVSRILEETTLADLLPEDEPEGFLPVDGALGLSREAEPREPEVPRPIDARASRSRSPR